MFLESHSRIVFVGDSITDAGRDPAALPGGWGFGQGYVNQIHCLLTAVYPDHEYVTINSGVSGDTILRMSKRWDGDVLALHPDYVSVMIGVNDVWRQYDQPFWRSQPDSIVPPELFETTYESLLSRTQSQVKGMIVMLPCMFESDSREAMRASVNDYAAIARRVAERHSAVIVDTQAAVDHVLAQVHPCVLSMDRVHPYERGSMVIARAWLQAMGFDWRRDSFDD